jgi:hypothetical protein
LFGRRRVGDDRDQDRDALDGHLVERRKVHHREGVVQQTEENGPSTTPTMLPDPPTTLTPPITQAATACSS